MKMGMVIEITLMMHILIPQAIWQEPWSTLVVAISAFFVLENVLKKCCFLTTFCKSKPLKWILSSRSCSSCQCEFRKLSYEQHTRAQWSQLMRFWFEKVVKKSVFFNIVFQVEIVEIDNVLRACRVCACAFEGAFVCLVFCLVVFCLVVFLFVCLVGWLVGFLFACLLACLFVCAGLAQFQN